MNSAEELLIVIKLESIAKRYYKDAVEKFGFRNKTLWDIHIPLVRRFAVQLAKEQNADSFVLDIAALLHDIGKVEGKKGHEKLGASISKSLLDSYGIPQDRMDLILKCIEKHSSYLASEDDELEVKILRSADALGTLFDDDWQDFCRIKYDNDLLFMLFDKSLSKISIPSARLLAIPQVELLRKMLEHKV